MAFVHSGVLFLAAPPPAKVAAGNLWLPWHSVADCLPGPNLRWTGQTWVARTDSAVLPLRTLLWRTKLIVLHISPNSCPTMFLQQ